MCRRLNKIYQVYKNHGGSHPSN